MNYWNLAREKLMKYSTCLKRQYACLIVTKDGIIASSGYNKSLAGCIVCARPDALPNTGSYVECSAIHAEQMALLEGYERGLIGGKLYLVCSNIKDPVPCPTCQKLMDYCGVTQEREVTDHESETDREKNS